ncbi:MAG TPA: flagellar basal-body MS-ring/collar protein FliF [Stellaceae bacterium]|nr:flagellar basal-body MS-ring/collar protein FliF [Stellaceae bacterium]
MAFLDAINPQAILERVRPVLGGRTRATVIAGGAVAATLVALATLWFWGSNYAVLYAGLSGEEGGRAIAELQKLNIPYRITEGGRVIEVPASDVGRARLQLAASGAVKHDGDEWAILDNESLGVSPFVEQVHYVRGIEAALSRTVGEVDGVVSAKVTLALPKQTDFLADSPKPSASVLVRLAPGKTLSGPQVTGIVGLVASSVPGLARENVTVVDQSGTVLNPTGDGLAMQAPQQLDLTREINHRYETLITDLLVPVLGRGNFRVSSDADIDFSHGKESLVKYGDSHVLSQDETVRIKGTGDQAIGIPGALSNERPQTPTTANPQQQNQQQNQPAQANTPGQANTPSQATTQAPPAAKDTVVPPSDTHKTTNYDIDKTVEFLEHPPWQLRGISIAVLVNNPSGSPLPAERLQSVNKLVTSAIGAGQNPHVTVVDLPFEPPDTANVAMTGPWWRAPWASGVGQNALLAVAGLLALFGGFFPATRRLKTLQASVAASIAAKAAAIRAGVSADSSYLIDAANSTMRPLPRARAEPQDVLSIEAETVQTLVTGDPARTAQVIRGWIAGGRGDLKRAD